MAFRRFLAFWAILPVAAALWFFVFWSRFDFWRRRRTLTYVAMVATFVAFGLLTLMFRKWTFAGRLSVPLWLQLIGWVLIAISAVIGTVADRQIGFRVRSFMPFFDGAGRIKLQTTGAYGIVRHPIYACGAAFQLGSFLVTGYPAVLLAWVVFTVAAVWFTRQEESRLVALLDDPTEYERYRQRVPALLPRWRWRSR